jgi:outer membrane protein
MFRIPAIRPAMFCLAFGLFASMASAQVKIGIINVQKALSDTDELKKSSADLQKKYQPRQDEAASIQKQLEDIDSQLNSGKLNAQAVQDLQSKGSRLQRDQQRLQEDLQADVDRDRQEILAKMSQKMQAVINKLAESKGLDLIVEASQTLYNKPALDLTAEATAAYNQANPAGSATPQAATPQATPAK